MFFGSDVMRDAFPEGSLAGKMYFLSVEMRGTDFFSHVSAIEDWKENPHLGENIFQD